jgi:hypothetical protein
LSEEQADLPTVDIPKKSLPKKRQAEKGDKVAANKKAKGVGPAVESENKSNGPGKEPKKPPAKKKASLCSYAVVRSYDIVATMS